LEPLPDPELTSIYTSLTAEMRFANSVADATYAAVGFHIKRMDAEHQGFHVTLDPGAFTDLVASACVIAQLDLLRRAARLFGWTTDEERIDGLLAEARELNEASASLE